VRNIFLFVRRYINFICFLLLQGFCIYLVVHYSRYHNAMFSSTANQFTGKINEQYNRVEYYFQLKKTNDSLVKANARLYNKLKADFNLPDSAVRTIVDSIRIDSLLSRRRYTYIPAKVIANSVSAQNNFLVIRKDGTYPLRIGMGVIDVNNGVVGIITDISSDYAVVMSLLHKDSKQSGMLFRGERTGQVTWDGKEPNRLTFSGIPKGTKVAKGDSIISSGYLPSFPKGMLMGTVLDVVQETSTNNVTIHFQSAANFYNIEYVYVIDNSEQEEINKLLEKAKKQTQ
jgi:rod shape-determining protein MreC